MNLIFRRYDLLFLAVALLGVGAGSLSGADSIATQSSLNDGYSLFSDFCDQESQLSLLLWIKTAPPAIADYAKRISTTAREDLAILKKFSADDNALRLDKVSLPGFEIAVRQSMAVDRRQQLIWGSSGAAFTQALTLTQSEATNYGLHVAKILAETEPDPDRARVMRQIFDKWSALHAEAYKLNR